MVVSSTICFEPSANDPTATICAGEADTVIAVTHPTAIGEVPEPITLVVTDGPVNVILYADDASCPPLKIALTLVADVLVNPTDTILVFWIFPDIPNTNAAITAARITVIATIRITPITGDTASSFFLVITIFLNTLHNAHVGHDNVYYFYVNL
jgi:hypothetical protein